MKLLIITPPFPPILNPEGIVTGKFARALVSAGVEVTVVTQEPAMQPRPVDLSECWVEGLGRVYRLKTSLATKRYKNYYAKIRWQDRMTTWFARAAFTFSRELLRRESFDYIMSRAPHSDAVYAAFQLQQEFGVRWLAAFGDPYPEFFYPEPYRRGRPENWFHRRQIKWVRWALEQAYRIIFPSLRLGRYLERKLGVEWGDRLLVVPHIGWTAGEEKEEENPFEILHAGSIGGPRVQVEFFEDLIEIATSFPALPERFRITLMGEIHDTLRQRLSVPPLSQWVQLEPLVPFIVSLKRMRKAGALLLAEAPLAEGIFLPSKFCDYTASGRPLLLFCPEEGTIADLVGGFRHPGFLGQRRETYRPRLEQFFQQLAEGEDLKDYAYPDPQAFSAARVARQFLAGLE